MKSLLRFVSHHSINPKLLPYAITAPRCFSSSTSTILNEDKPVFPSYSMEKQFNMYRSKFMESKPKSRFLYSFPDMQLDSDIQMLEYSLHDEQLSIFLHGYCPSPDSCTMNYFTGSLRRYYNGLAGACKLFPEKYYENYSRWEDQRRKTISIISFLHWLETGKLVLDTEFEQKLNGFHFEPEDYVVGLTMMTSQLPGYVVHQALAGDYETPKKALQLLNDVFTLFQAINAQDDKSLSKCFLSVMETIRRVGKMSEDVKVLMPRK